MRILITGGAGYIGSVVCAQLLASRHEVVVVDDLSTGHLDAVPPGAEFHRAGITDLDGMLAGLHVEAVIHFAAKSLVGESIANPAGYWHHNVGGTLALLDAMRTGGVSRIVFSSSAAVYGDATETPIRESAPTRPSSCYGATKLAVDLALGDYAIAYGLAAVSLRYFNVAGALVAADGARYGERHLDETHLVPLALHAVADRTKSLSVYGSDYPTPDGTCVRDYIHVLDLAEAHLLALGIGAPGEHHVINLGSGKGSSVREVIATVREVTGRDFSVHERPRRPGDPAILVAANDLAATMLGWQPRRHLAQMVADAWTFVGSGRQ
jgi:UDP-glucose 4-epimerase